MCYWTEMLTLVRFENNHYTTAPSSGLKDISLMTYSKEFLVWDEEEFSKICFKSSCIQRPVTYFTDLSDLEVLKLLRFLETKEFRTR